MAFTKAIRQAAPDALEVADPWHLLQNLSTAVEKTCRQHRDCLRRPAGSEANRGSKSPQAHVAACELKSARIEVGAYLVAGP
ncbi:MULTISPECIES: transposase [unclassified Streptomyces]|uniref:transposase n=1 Tax=Streptomyces sp. Ag109_G2-15 TaxID=1938850 RepID=UPI000D1C17CE